MFQTKTPGNNTFIFDFSDVAPGVYNISVRNFKKVVLKF